MVDILGKCALSWWISWANVHYHGGYLGQMCIIMMDILGKCAISLWISWANVHLYIMMDKLVWLLVPTLLKKDDIVRLVDICNVSDKLGVPCGFYQSKAGNNISNLNNMANCNNMAN